MPTYKKRRICVPNGNVQKLMEATGASQTSVYAALSYACNSKRAMTIRRLALDHYEGKIITSKYV